MVRKATLGELSTNVVQFSNHCLPAAPSGPPLNLLVEVEDSQTLFLSWEPPSPEQQNGIIRQYTVTVIASNTGAVVTTVTVVATTLRVSGLDPFTNYTCSVAAYTVGTGPAALSPPVETLHSGKLMSRNKLWNMYEDFK